MLMIVSVVFVTEAIAQSPGPPPVGEAPVRGEEKGEEKMVSGEVKDIDPSRT